MWHFLPSFKNDISTLTRTLVCIATAIFVIGIGLYFAKIELDAEPVVAETWVGKKIMSARQKNWFGSGVVLTLSAIFQGSVWDGVKALFGS